MQLFSNPQQTQASRTRREPRENRRLSLPSKERMMHAAVTRKMAAQMAGSHKTVKEPLSFLWNLSDGVGNNKMSDAWFTD